jgi:ligand-binding sensor domain-containing protein/AraC-like DNA-binding protein
MENKKKIPYSKTRFSFSGYLFFIFMVFLFQPLLAVKNDSYVFKAWMMEDGLPQNSILTILQTKKGYLWFGTELGLVRFNGTLFYIHNTWNTQALKNNKITSLCEDGKGTLWIGTNGGGISSLNGGQWENYDTDKGLSNNYITVITKTRDSHLLIGTKKGLTLLKKGKFSTPSGKVNLSGLSISSILEVPDGSIWVGSKKGLYKSVKSFNQKPLVFELFLPIAVNCLFLDKDKNIWVGTEQGLKKIKDNQIKTFTMKEGLASNWITSIYQDKGGSMWFGTYGDGICILKEDQFQQISTQNGLSDDFIHTITEDHEGNLWIGTYAGGIIRISPKIIYSIARENGLPENTVNTVLQDNEGFLWIGTRHRGLCKFRNSNLVKTYTTDDGLSSNRIRSLFKSREGDLWIGTNGGGLNHLKDNKFSIYRVKDGLSSNNITSIHQSRAGTLWIGTDKGLDRMKQGIIIKDTKTEVFTGFFIRTIYEDQKQNLWVGTNQGLSKITEKMVQHIRMVNDQLNYDILALYESQAFPGVIWIGTNGNGLIRFENNRITLFTAKEGLHNNYIFSINETGHPLSPEVKQQKYKSYLWMSSYRGIFRISLDALNQYSKKELGFITSTFFNEADGMKSRECTGFTQPAAWRLKNEKLFFPTVKGVAVVDTQKITVKKNAPPVCVEDVIIDNESYINKKNPKIPSGKRMFELYFTALSFTAPDKIIYRYKLEGFEKEWVTLGSNEKRTAIYLNLKPGKYNFRVIACNNYGNWNQRGAEFSFQVRSDLEKSLLVYIPRILVLLLFVVGFFIWRRKKTKPVKKVKKYQTSALTPDRAEQILKKLLATMEEEEIYLDPDLTLKKLSEKIMVHPNHISQIVNDTLNQSFNDFVNSYRIKTAQEKLLNPREMDKTILEIAYDVGFYSKSVFNTAFKKFTGLTPSQFKQKKSKK